MLVLMVLSLQLQLSRSSGIIQSSILEPVLFVPYAKNIPSSCHASWVKLYNDVNV